MLLNYYIYLCILGVIDHVIKACPNIEELHIDCLTTATRNVNISRDKSWGAEIEWLQLFSTIQFKHLTWLSISGNEIGDGDYLPSVYRLRYWWTDFLFINICLVQTDCWEMPKIGANLFGKIRPFSNRKTYSPSRSLSSSCRQPSWFQVHLHTVINGYLRNTNSCSIVILS